MYCVRQQVANIVRRKRKEDRRGWREEKRR
jgi:hypothetical protein